MRREDRRIADQESLRALFEQADVCRLAFAVGELPYIVTLNFGFEWVGPQPLLFFHCARKGRKLEMMEANPRVCFELDLGHELVTGSAPCDWGMKYASIVGYGLLRRVAGEEERRRGLDRIMEHYGWGGAGEYSGSTLKATELLALEVDELSGKRKA